MNDSLNVVVLASGSGTLLQAILDNQGTYRVQGVVADVPCTALERAQRTEVPTKLVRLEAGADREAWNRRLAEEVARFHPDLVVSAGFMKILGEGFLTQFGGRTINTHPALLPSFPGAHAVRDALAYGVKITGTTVHFVDEGVDTGPIIAQEAVPVPAGASEAEVHEEIKRAERMLIVSVLNACRVDQETKEVSFQL
ncbi:phosphoribosylglycinamide formyltransferase [Corynebacterium gerontici]|uniref:Phosphoribosylglycinamide formyltransferase n=1 Tax=Corynebacterium gerontici TaxID=2079234 RepID=A0A3G6IZ78_9CORY|nr:phosphoribosylglycinamide formyltransferase [Corynebacterium gerontici]AZA11012.1 Phosphoribosylglycinamide formyltransferase [Corynebacterium gerontici]